MSINSLGITLERRDSIEFHASRSEETAWVAVRVDGALCEIRMERAHVEALRDQIPGVLAGLERVAAEDAACERAEIASERRTRRAGRWTWRGWPRRQESPRWPRRCGRLRLR